jgi:hypothetical protein
MGKVILAGVVPKLTNIFDNIQLPDYSGGRVSFVGGRIQMSTPESTVQPLESVLYYDGADSSGLTGGFSSAGHLVWHRDESTEDESWYNFNYSNANSIFNTKVMELQGTGSDGKDIRGYAITNNKIDFTKIKSIDITFAYSGYDHAGSLKCTIAVTPSTTFEGNVDDYVVYNNRMQTNSVIANNTIHTYTLDCSNVTGEHYLCLALDCEDIGVRNFYISKLVANLER